jgi:hypothetical protein
MFGVGAVLAAFRAPLPERVVLGSIVVGSFMTVIAGAWVIGREWRRNRLWGRRWLRFWESRLGEWTEKLAGIGLGRIPSEPVLVDAGEALGPAPGRPQVEAGPAGAELRVLADFHAAVNHTESWVRRGHAYLAASTATREREGRSATPEEVESEQTLQRHLVVLQAYLEKFLGADVALIEAGSFTADLQGAREVCAVVEGLMEGSAWEV